MYRFLMVFRAIAGVLTFGRIEMGISSRAVLVCTPDCLFQSIEVIIYGFGYHKIE